MDEHGRGRESTEKSSYDKLIKALGRQLSADEVAQLAAEGASWSEKQPIEEALKSSS